MPEDRVLLDEAERAMAHMPDTLKNWVLFDAAVNWDPVWIINQYNEIVQDGWCSAAEASTMIIEFLRKEERQDLARLMVSKSA